MQLSLVALLLVAGYAGCVSGATLQLSNQCQFAITAYSRQGSPSPTKTYSLAPGATANIDAGSSSPANVIWGSASGNDNNAQASQLEITVGSNGNDYYDISLVNAYNLPTRIQPVNLPAGADPNGLQCGTPTCSIPGSLSDFCKPPNTFGGSGNGGYCINTDGPGQTATDGTKAFKNYCATSYSYSTDDATSTYACKTGGDYQFIFCPGSK